MYNAGKYISYKHPLNEIKIYKGNSSLGGYSIGRTEYNMTSPLSWVARCDSAGNTLPALRMTYSANSTYFPSTTRERKLDKYIGGVPLDELHVGRGSFDRDTENDGLFMFPNRDSYYYYSNKVHNRYKDSDSIIVTTRVRSDSTWIWCNALSVGHGFVDAFAADVDGDGHDELIRVNNFVNSTTDSLKINVFRQGAVNKISLSQIGSKSYSRPGAYKSGKYSVHPRLFFCGDFTGNGKDELLILTQTDPHDIGQPVDVELTTLDNFAPLYTGSIDSCRMELPHKDSKAKDRLNYFNLSDRVLTLDYNGDGKIELAIMNGAGLKIYSFKSVNSGANAVMQTKTCEFNENKFTTMKDCRLLSGDFNGDGIHDLLKCSLVTSAIKTFLGSGTGSFVAMDSVLTVEYGIICGHTLTDVNGDGITDMLSYVKTNDSNSTIYLHSFNNGKCYGMSSVTVPGSGKIVPASTRGDIMRNGASFMSLHSNGSLIEHSYNWQKDVKYLLAGITDGHGLERTFSYERLGESRNFEGYGSQYETPFRRFAEGVPVCTGAKTILSGDTISAVTYEYVNPVMHNQGLGFCGFERIITYDSINSRVSNCTFAPLSLGMPVRKSTDKYFEEYDSEAIVDSHRAIHRRVKHISRTELATGLTTSTSYYYDDRDNIVTQSQVYASNDSIFTTYNYLPAICDINHNLPSVLSNVVTTTTIGGSSSITGRQLTYDTSHLPLTDVTYYSSVSSPVSSTKYVRDANCRLIRVEKRAYNGDWVRDKSFTYTGQNRMPESEADRFGYNYLLQYSGFGLKNKSLAIRQEAVIDPIIPNGAEAGLNGGGTHIPDNPIPDLGDPDLYGLNTQFHYDGMGRIDSIHHPTDTHTLITRSWAEENNVNAVLMTTTNTTGEPLVKDYYDALGRRVRQSVQQFDGSWLTVDSVYDSHGRLAMTSRPSKTNTRHWTTYSYDMYDRLQAVSYYDGRTDTYSYDGLSTTVTTGGVTTTRTFDCLGRLISVSDPGGTIEYELRPDGQPMTITVNDTISTTFGYDGYGRRTDIYDPSAGHRVYQYDANGNVSKVTDGRGKWTATTWNAIGLPVEQETSDGLSAVMEYDNVSRITAVTDNAGHTHTWTYDSNMRLSDEDVDGFKKSFTYSGNNISSIAYSLGNTYICSENVSYSYGHKSSVSMNGSASIWALASMSNRGLVTGTTSGPLYFSMGYDATGNITSCSVRKGRLLRHSSSYVYDTATGNMTARTVAGQSEQFTYDGLNRLTGDGMSSVAYDDLGNPTSVGAAGLFTYGGTSPYALTFLDVAGTSVPLRSQTIAYNAMQLPDSITENGVTASFTYRGDGSRSGMTVTAGGGFMRQVDYRDRLTSYIVRVGDVDNTRDVLWLGGSAYDAPAALMRVNGSAWTLHRVIRDNLGSIVAVTDSAGTIEQRICYDAWGRLRNPDTGDCYGPDEQPELMLGHGYTGHEHLPWFGLINMNARLYDPAVHRFLSPDPEVQLPDNTQNYNRYTYCLNNPLRYTDPTGLRWLMSQFADEYFIFFDYRVNDIVDLVRFYKTHSDIVILDDDSVVKIRDIDTGETIHEFELFSDGSFSKDGVSQSGEYNREGRLHIGSTNYTDISTISHNYYGSYLGPHNPMLKDNDGYSYAFPPRDLHDYFAFQHDIDYDKVGAVGTYDALFNKKTLEADLSLAIKMDAFPITKYSLWGWPTSRLFYYLAYGKFIGSLIDL